MKLIVGLGNPGREYKNTRHNIGFMILDNYLGNVEWKEKFLGLYYTCIVKGEKVIFLKPQTYMNLSGSSVLEVVNYFKVDVNDILVIHDDLDMEFGHIKLKHLSSSGGHNGIKSITKCLNSDLYCRFKFGISNNKMIDTKDYVLGKFTKEELDYIDDNKTKFANIINSFIINGIDKTMNDFNRK
ncbi:MAG: aminoacyl-tRNA hydrolase [Bacilli bacterium]